jgi:hypothetical protein
MSKNLDSWCQPLRQTNGRTLYGGAARNVRIARFGGMDEIVADVVRSTIEKAEARASAAINADKVVPFRRRAA